MATKKKGRSMKPRPRSSRKPPSWSGPRDDTQATDAAPRLPEPACLLGYTHRQLAEILGVRIADFREWFAGQTGAICEGRLWDREQTRYAPACGGVAHGPVVYRHDVERFLLGLPVVD